MQEFLHIALSFPTLIYTVLLVVCLVFATMLIIGGVGIDLDVFDVDLDLDVDPSGAEEAGSAVFQILSSFGVGTVPMSIFATSFIFVGWVLTYFATLGAHTFLEVGWLVGAAVLLVTTAAALPITGMLLAPLQTLMKGTRGVADGEHLIGEICELTTSRVDAGFGQARCFAGGATLVLSIRCPHENSLSRGDRALIINFDEANNLYEVEPFEELLGADGPEDTGIEETVLDNIDFDALDEAAERHEEEKAKAVQTQN